MNARFLILLVVALGLVIFVVVRKPGATAPVDFSETGGLAEGELEKIRSKQKSLNDYDFPGEEPAESPEFDVQVMVNPASGKHQICFDVTELHGYFVATLELAFWWVGDDPSIEFNNSKFATTHVVDEYIKANDVYHKCLELVPVEMDTLDNHLGDDENWRAAIIHHGQARETNPDPLPISVKPFESADKLITGKVRNP